MRQRIQSSEGQKDRFSKHSVPAPKRRKTFNSTVKMVSVDGDRYVSHTLNGLHEEYEAIEKQIKLLRTKQNKISKELREQGYFDKEYFARPFYIYVLELEDGHYYIGQSRNPERRLEKHKNGTGAIWTRKHKVVRLVETIPTEALVESEAQLAEDQVTIEYAIRYCAQKVRGGGYTQTEYVRWPQEVLDAEKICSHI